MYEARFGVIVRGSHGRTKAESKRSLAHPRSAEGAAGAHAGRGARAEIRHPRAATSVRLTIINKETALFVSVHRVK